MTIQMLSFPCPHILANAIDRNRSLDTKHNQHVTDSHEKYKTEKKLGVFFLQMQQWRVGFYCFVHIQRAGKMTSVFVRLNCQNNIYIGLITLKEAQYSEYCFFLLLAIEWVEIPADLSNYCTEVLRSIYNKN